jgi:hypothetical protein
VGPDFTYLCGPIPRAEPADRDASLGVTVSLQSLTLTQAGRHRFAIFADDRELGSVTLDADVHLPPSISPATEAAPG